MENNNMGEEFKRICELTGRHDLIANFGERVGTDKVLAEDAGDLGVTIEAFSYATPPEGVPIPSPAGGNGSWATPKNKEPKQEDTGRMKQVGGDHYAKHSVQVWDIVDLYGLNFYEGNILKYLLRDKGNRGQDLRKIAHYVEKLIENEGEDNVGNI